MNFCCQHQQTRHQPSAAQHSRWQLRVHGHSSKGSSRRDLTPRSDASRTPSNRLISLSAAVPASADVQTSSTESREDALLLSYCASQGQSLFAAQCFVETVLDAYTCGANVDSLQTGLQLKNMQQGGSLLQPQDEQLMLSWIILVMLAAKEVGVPAPGQSPSPGPAQGEPQQQQELGQGSGQQDTLTGAAGDSSSTGTPPAAAAAAAEGISTSYSREVMGLLQFAKQAAKLFFEEGHNVRSLQSLQATIASDRSQGNSQFLHMMQQYTLLVVISLEVIAQCRLPTNRALENPISLTTTPSGYTAAWAQPLPMYSTLQQQAQASSNVSGSSSSGSSSSSETSGLITAAALAAGKGGLRAHSVKLMTAFVGAVLGAPYSLKAFVLGALEAYEAGVPAEALHKQLAEQEFEQTGGLVPALPLPEVTVDVNRKLFGRWLSLVYMSAAQLNAVFPGAAQHSGWAWYGGEDEVQANAMAGFVGQTLTRLQQEAAAAAGAGDSQDLDTAQVPQDPLVQRLKSTPESAEQLEAASKQLQQELREQGTLHGKEVPVMVRMPDPDLAATSGAVRLWRQQVELVDVVYQYMCALQAMTE